MSVKKEESKALVVKRKTFSRELVAYFCEKLGGIDRVSLVTNYFNAKSANFEVKVDNAFIEKFKKKISTLPKKRFANFSANPEGEFSLDIGFLGEDIQIFYPENLILQDDDEDQRLHRVGSNERKKILRVLEENNLFYSKGRGAKDSSFSISQTETFIKLNVCEIKPKNPAIHNQIFSILFKLYQGNDLVEVKQDDVHIVIHFEPKYFQPKDEGSTESPSSGTVQNTGHTNPAPSLDINSQQEEKKSLKELAIDQGVNANLAIQKAQQLKAEAVAAFISSCFEQFKIFQMNVLSSRNIKFVEFGNNGQFSMRELNRSEIDEIFDEMNEHFSID